jgi:hypothetical protein
MPAQPMSGYAAPNVQPIADTPTSATALINGMPGTPNPGPVQVGTVPPAASPFAPAAGAASQPAGAPFAAPAPAPAGPFGAAPTGAASPFNPGLPTQPGNEPKKKHTGRIIGLIIAAVVVVAAVVLIILFATGTLKSPFSGGGTGTQTPAGQTAPLTAASTAANKTLTSATSGAATVALTSGSTSINLQLKWQLGNDVKSSTLYAVDNSGNGILFKNDTLYMLQNNSVQGKATSNAVEELQNVLNDLPALLKQEGLNVGTLPNVQVDSLIQNGQIQYATIQSDLSQYLTAFEPLLKSLMSASGSSSLLGLSSGLSAYNLSASKAPSTMDTYPDVNPYSGLSSGLSSSLMGSVEDLLGNFDGFIKIYQDWGTQLSDPTVSQSFIENLQESGDATNGNYSFSMDTAKITANFQDFLNSKKGGSDAEAKAAGDLSTLLSAQSSSSNSGSSTDDSSSDPKISFAIQNGFMTSLTASVSAPSLTGGSAQSYSINLQLSGINSTDLENDATIDGIISSYEPVV